MNEETIQLSDAFDWLVSTIVKLIEGLNFEITLSTFTFHLLDFIIVLTVIGILYKRFIHDAR